MRIECPTCHELVPLDSFVVRGNRIEQTCAACSATIRAESSAKSAAGKAESGAADFGKAERCPKCQATLEDGLEACARCGLARDKFSDFDGADADAPEQLVELWNQCVDDWDDQEIHRKFLDEASDLGAYAYAARCYRRRQVEHADDSTSVAQLNRIARMAEARLKTTVVASSPSEGKKPYRGVLILLLLLAMLAAVLGIAVLLRNLASERGDGAAEPVPVKQSEPDKKGKRGTWR